MFSELERDHRYMMMEPRREQERTTTMWKQVGKRLKLTAAVCMVLVVPEDSALGEAILRNRKAKKKESKKR